MVLPARNFHDQQCATRGAFAPCCTEFQRSAASERGIAFIEFTIALPFLALMFISLVDVGYALNQYMMLRDVVNQGVRYAAGSGDVSAGTPYCQTSGTAPSSKVDSRVVDLVERQQKSLHENSLCVESGVSGSEVFVEASAQYSGIFPAFDNLRISARATATKLF